MKLLFSISLLLVLASCNKEKFWDGPNTLADDFESAATVDDLTSESGNWKYYQTTDDQNTMTLDTSIVHSGNQSLKFTAKPSLNGASKSDIAHNKLAFDEGKTFYFSSWFYLEGTQSLNYIFLFDIEESVNIGAGPGVRVALRFDDGQGYLVLERNKLVNETTITQSEESQVAFPRNQWVHFEIELFMKRNKKGSVKIWQNDQLVIDQNGIRTMPKDKAVFLQGSKGIYNSIQVGITANSSEDDATLFIDDLFCEER